MSFWLKALALVVCSAALVMTALLWGGSVYWQQEGGGSPADFRESVASTGLEVDWSENGSKGGSGAVMTECGKREVSVSLRSGQLWVTVASDEFELDEETANLVVACRAPG